jgi:integrase
MPAKPTRNGAYNTCCGGSGLLRLGEALALAWRDVDLARGTIEVRDGKTAAAARRI